MTAFLAPMSAEPAALPPEHKGHAALPGPPWARGDATEYWTPLAVLARVREALDLHGSAARRAHFERLAQQEGAALAQQVADELDTRLVLASATREERAECIRWVQAERGPDAAARVEALARKRWRAMAAAGCAPSPPGESSAPTSRAPGGGVNGQVNHVPVGGSSPGGSDAGDSDPMHRVESGDAAR